MSASQEPNRRILVIDDDPTIHQAFRSILAPVQAGSTALDALAGELFPEAGAANAAAPLVPFDVDIASQGMQGLERVRSAVADSQPYGMAFVDMRMPPGWDGLETIEQLWRADPELEIVLCTAYSDYSWDQIERRLGRTHRLLLLRKPFDRAEVWQLAGAQSRKRAAETEARLQQAALAAANQRLEAEISARKRAENQLKHDAIHDALTGLPNRVLLADRLKQCIARARRCPEYHYAVLFLDLDDFKLVNDSLGHSIGDQLLIDVARRIQESLRATDTATRLREHTPVRLGGDEFVILLEGLTSAADARLVAARLRETVSQTVCIAGHGIPVSISVGVAHGDADYEVPDDILRDADAALYHSKALGRGRVEVFDDEIRQQILHRLRLGADLQQAIDRRELRLVYQPIVALESRRIKGLEALLRWDHPELGAISPAQFIPIAERNGAINDVGRWVLREACQQLRVWHDQIPQARSVSISVNVSSKQLLTGEFIDQVRSTLADTGLVGRSLNIELTESVIIENSKSVQTVLGQLRDLGVSVHLDDFGTGYSSLGHLHALPLDAIKIDRMFVKDMQLDPAHAVTIHAIQAMASSRGMDVIAEGIESEETLILLQGLGCELGQGFFLSHPVDAAAARQLLEQECVAERPVAAAV